MTQTGYPYAIPGFRHRRAKSRSMLCSRNRGPVGKRANDRKCRDLPRSGSSLRWLRSSIARCRRRVAEQGRVETTQGGRVPQLFTSHIARSSDTW